MCLTIAVSDMLELRNSWRDFQAEVQNLLLALETDVCGPSYHARKVALRLNVLSDTVVLGALLEERILR